MSPDLAETVKQLREWTDAAIAESNPGHFVFRGFRDACTPKAISSILDALEGLERDNASLRKRLRISQDQYAEADFASIQRGEGSLSGFKP